MLPGANILLILLASRAVRCLNCDNPGECDDNLPGYYNRGGHDDLGEDLRGTRSEFYRKPVDPQRDDPLNSKYESLVKSINDMHRMLQQNNKRMRSQDKIIERYAEQLPASEYETENKECSSWALQNVAALMRASRAGNSRLIASIISSGTSVDAVDENGGGRTALHWAVTKGKLAAVRQLLELGASVNKPAAGVSNETPLHMAAALGDLPMVQILVENGADVYALNGQCVTPQELSVVHSHQEVAIWLQENAERYTRCREFRATTKLIPYERESTPAPTTAMPLTTTTTTTTSTMSTSKAVNSTMPAITTQRPKQ